MLIISLIGIAIVLFVIFKAFNKGHAKEKEGNFEYIKVGDPKAQVTYDAEKNPKKQSLSAAELLELSWKFLYDITEKVLYKFAARAKKDVHECGRKLVEAGVKYQHSIDYTPIAAKNYAKKVEDSEKDSSEVQR